MDKIKIKGGANLFGSINIPGSKNAALPVMVSSLLSKENLKKELENLNLKYDRFLILPIFLFRGNLLDNLITVIKEINKKSKNKFILCSHLTNYKNVFNLMNNLIKFKIT